MTSSSGTTSKTSDIGVGTENVDENEAAQVSLQYSDTNNDAITDISMVSENSISIATSNSNNICSNRKNSPLSNENNTKDIENGKEMGSQIRYRSCTSSTQMQSEVGCDFNKTTFPSELHQEDGCNILLNEIQVLEGSSDIVSTDSRNRPNCYSDTSSNIRNEASNIYNCNINDNHSNKAFIFEEKQ